MKKLGPSRGVEQNRDWLTFRAEFASDILDSVPSMLAAGFRSWDLELDLLDSDLRRELRS